MAILNKLLRSGIYLALFLGALVCSLYLTSKWIIQSEEEVLVPNLVGHDTVYALDLLTSLGLNIKVGGFMWSESVPKNFIAQQEPLFGTWLKRDRDVKVIIYRGSQSVRVPKIVGTRLREAKLVLSQNGLHLGGICRVPSSQHPRDTIIAQTPAPLQEIARGEYVDFLVSDGPEDVAVAMPELRQRPVGQALKILNELGLAATRVKEVHQPGLPLNTIVGQRPLAGYRVDAEISLILTVNRLPQHKESQSRLWWITYQMEPGYFKKEVALSRQQDWEVIPLYSRIHLPGEQLDWLVWARSPEEVSVFVDGVPQRLKPRSFDWGDMARFRYLSTGGELRPAPQKSWRAQ
jgi:beta-lactam-binding protein with PASTA domain